MVVQRATSRKRSRQPVCTVARTSMPIAAGLSPAHVPFPNVGSTSSLHQQYTRRWREEPGRLAGEGKRCAPVPFLQRRTARIEPKSAHAEKRQTATVSAYTGCGTSTYPAIWYSSLFCLRCGVPPAKRGTSQRSLLPTVPRAQPLCLLKRAAAGLCEQQTTRSKYVSFQE